MFVFIFEKQSSKLQMLNFVLLNHKLCFWMIRLIQYHSDWTFGSQTYIRSSNNSGSKLYNCDKKCIISALWMINSFLGSNRTYIYLLPIFTLYYSIYKMKKNLEAKKLFNWFAFTDLLSFLIPSFIYKLYFYSPFAFMKKTSWTQTKTCITFHCTKSF